MSEQDPERTSTLGRSLFLAAGALGRDTVRPLRRHAAGGVDEALRQAEALLGVADPVRARQLRLEAADELFRRNLAFASIHPSWFVEPLRLLPAAMLTAVLSLLPPRLMRYTADLMEERLGLRFGRITLNELSPALARRFAFSLLPPSAGPRAADHLPRALLAGPLAELERRPFPEPLDPATPERPRSEAERRLHEEAGLQAAVAQSVARLALALAWRPDEATCLALRMPRAAGRIFLELSRESALLMGSETARELYETFRAYVENDLETEE